MTSESGAAPARLAPIDFTRRAALVIDDHPFMRAIVRNVLHDMGFGVVLSASDGAEALRLLAGDDRRIDVIVCDIDMEPMNGIEFLAQLRENVLLELRSIPVILLTSHAERTNVAQARAEGANAYLLKPVSRANLQSRVEFVMAR